MTEPGLAVERSWLAWNRTAIGTVALAAVLLKVAMTRHRPLEFAASGFGFFEAAIVWSALAYRVNHRAMARSHRLAFLVAMMTVGIGVLTLISLLANS